jgi:hypothetical protein
MTFRSGMQFLVAADGDPPRSLCREVVDRPLPALQSAIERGSVHESPIDVHLASTTGANLRPNAAYAERLPATTVGNRAKRN